MIDPQWGTAFLLTVAIEVPIVVAAMPQGCRRPLLGIALAVQMVTHPLAWLAAVHWLVDWWSVEACVCAVEASVYAFASRRPVRALWVSLLANACSAGAGLWLFRA